MYGLNDTSINWYFSIKEEMLKIGCEQSKLDKSMFRWYMYEDGKLQGLFLMHVDDFLHA